MLRRLFLGPVVHSKALNHLEVLPSAAVSVHDGKIESIKNVSEIISTEGYEVIKLKRGQFIMPGFVDTHTHAPQYVNCGLGLDMQLLDWLDTYTFPAESKFVDPTFARRVYEKCVRRHLKNGTTTALYFGTIHAESCIVLGHIAKKLGQRAFIGKVNMDREAPDFYKETTEDSLRDTETFIQNILKIDDGNLVRPIITPRFVITCTSELMSGLGRLGAKYDVPIQSHVSENKGEIQFVSKLHPECSSYTEVYDKHGLMTAKTVMAHGIYLTDEELQIFRNRQSMISHCPLSNFSIHSGVCDVIRALRFGVKVGIGTDVSGGYAASMVNACRTTMIASSSVYSAKVQDSDDVNETVNRFLNEKEKHDNDYEPLTLAQVFHMATLGGASGVGLEDRIGNFEIGKDFDALIIDIDVEGGPIDAFLDEYDFLYGHARKAKLEEEEAEKKKVMDMFERFMYCGDDRNIISVYVGGEKVSFN
jgi:guanine deaminase